jgi:flavoprotein
MKVGKYAKFIVSAVMAGGTALTVALGDNVITTTEGIAVALAILGALGVYVVPNAREDGPAAR